MLSSGLYVAMVTTVGGLIVGILAYFGYNYLTARVGQVVYKMDSTAIEFMDILNEPSE
jgi:biopolymer transport protein ExbB